MDAKIKGFMSGLSLGMATAIILFFSLLLGLILTHSPEPISKCTGFSQVRPVDWNASRSSETISLTINIDAKDNVKLEQINVTVFRSNCTNRNNLSKDLMPGENYTINVTDCNLPAINEYYKADIWIVYTNLKSNITHNSAGECHGIVQK
jgi:hypothetical protein